MERSGLPFGNSFDMKQAQVGARGAIAPNVGDHGAGGFNKGILAQLDQIAQMDKKLSSTYSDPTSNLYIENPMAREGAIYGHRNTGMGEVNSLAGKRDNALQERDSEIKQAESLYNDLTTAQAQVEAEQKKQETQTKKLQTAATKKANTVKSGNGTDFELSKADARQARNAKVNLKDAKAVSEFFNKSSEPFRKYMEDEGIDGNIKSNNLSAKEIKEARAKWEKGTKEYKAKQAADTAAKKKADTEKAKGGKKKREDIFK